MSKKFYTISYWLDQEELHLTILDGKEIVYTEAIIGDFEDNEDVKLTCLEVAQSHGYSPALFEDDASRYGREGGKKASAHLTPEQRQKRAKEAAQKRWSKR
jgi:hypothetical protein